MKIAVLGGGHGGYAAAADLTLRGYEVCLFTFSAARVETLHNNDNVISYTASGARAAAASPMCQTRWRRPFPAPISS